jgi:hypothetical protein
MITNGAALHEGVDFNEWARQQDTDAEPFNYVLARDITLTPKPWLISGLVGAGEVSAWYGPPDAGKSTVVLDAACHVAAGLDWCGRRVQQGPVLYIAVERGAVTLRRVLAWRSHHRQADIPLAVVAEMIDLRTDRLDADRIIATAGTLTQACRQPVAWIITDTLNRSLAGGDENSSKDMGALLTSVQRIHHATGAHISLVHHVPVDRTDRMRGHGSVLGNVDLTVRITKTDKTVLLEADKGNDLVDKPRHAFRFQSIELTRDPDTGEVTTAPVMVPCDTPPAPATKQRSLPKAAQIALRALHEAIAGMGTIPPAANHIPRNTRVATFDQWRTYAFRAGISTSDEIRVQGQAFRRATEHLIATGHVGAWDGHAWPAR